MLTLYQFSISHFCEKVRWALDHKRLEYRSVNLLPGLHLLVTKKMAPRSSVPILVDNDRIVQDSTAIISYLDQYYPQERLTPVDSSDAAETADWERYLGKEIGVPIRQWAYYHLLPDRERALRALLKDGPWYGPLVLNLFYRQLQARMNQALDLRPESVHKAEQRFMAAFERLDNTVQQREYLVSNRFTRADLTACALLSPYCAIYLGEEDLRSRYPEAIRAHRASTAQRPFFRWVKEIYRKHRHPQLP